MQQKYAMRVTLEPTETYQQDSEAEVLSIDVIVKAEDVLEAIGAARRAAGRSAGRAEELRPTNCANLGVWTDKEDLN